MNLAGLLTAAGGRAPSTPGVETGGPWNELHPEAPEGAVFAVLLDMPSQPWASGGELSGPTAKSGLTPGDEPAEPTDYAVPESRGVARDGSPASVVASTSLPVPAVLPGDAEAPMATPTTTGASAQGPANERLPTSDVPTRTSDGALAVRVPEGEAHSAHDLPSRTLAMLDDVLQRPVRLLAAETGPAMPVAQPLPDPAAPPVVSTPMPPAATQPREMLPGHLPLAAARTPDGDESAEQLNARLNWMASHQVGRAQIRLSPPHLGTVEIDVEIRDGKVRADFGANNAEARALLEAGLPRLREMFSSQGLQLVHSEVSSSLSQGQGQQADAQARRDSHASARAPGSDRSGAGDDPSDAADNTRPVQLGRGLVDEFA